METDEKLKIIVSKKFLNCNSFKMIAFPFYAHIFYPNADKQVIVVDKSNIRTIEFS